MKVKLPSVTRAIKKLSLLGFVEHKSYGEIILTEKGWRIGKELSIQEDILIRFLQEILSFNKEMAIQVSKEMEYTINAETSARMQILIDFALSSNAWIKRLQIRMNRFEESNKLTNHKT